MMGFRQRKLAPRGWLGMRDNLLVSASSPCTFLQNGCIEVGAAGRACETRVGMSLAWTAKTLLQQKLSLKQGSTSKPMT